MMQGRWAVVILLIGAALVHAAYFAANDELLTDDSYSYLAPAERLAAGAGFVNAHGVPETRRTPGYPLFLAPFSSSPASLRTAVVLQHFLSIALLLGVVMATLALTGSRRAGLAAGFILLADVPTLHHANSILTENLFTAFVFAGAAAIYLAIPRQSGALSALAGLLGGLAVLIRPIGMYFFVPACVVLMLFGRARRATLAFAFVAAFAIPPLGWAAWNSSRTGMFTVSTISPWSLLCDRAAATLAIDEPGSFGTNVMAARRELLGRIGEPDRFSDPNHSLTEPYLIPADRYRDAALEVIVSRPLAYVRVWLRALTRTLLPGGVTQLHRMTGISLPLLTALVLAVNAVVTVAALVGILRLWSIDRTATAVAVAIIAYYLVTVSVGEPSARFRVPIQPLLAILAGTALAVRSGRTMGG